MRTSHLDLPASHETSTYSPRIPTSSSPSWPPGEEPLKGKTLVYILAQPSRDAATANWQAFRDDPEWQSVRDKSEANGKLVEKVDSTFLVLTDFSPTLR